MSERIIIIGLGNELLSDDGAGLELAKHLFKLLPTETADLELTDMESMSLMHALEGYSRAIIIDSIENKDYRPGECLRTKPGMRLTSIRLSGKHSAPFAEALRIGESLNLPIPKSVSVYLINVQDRHTFHEGLSKTVEDAIPAAARRIAFDEFGLE